MTLQSIVPSSVPICTPWSLLLSSQWPHRVQHSSPAKAPKPGVVAATSRKYSSMIAASAPLSAAASHDWCWGRASLAIACLIGYYDLQLIHGGSLMSQILPVTKVARHFAEYSNRVHPLSAVHDRGSALAIDYSRRLTSKRHNVRAGK